VRPTCFAHGSRDVVAPVDGGKVTIDADAFMMDQWPWRLTRVHVNVRGLWVRATEPWDTPPRCGTVISGAGSWELSPPLWSWCTHQALQSPKETLVTAMRIGVTFPQTDIGTDPLALRDFAHA